jgi:gliding motility-associated-like protein
LAQPYSSGAAYTKIEPNVKAADSTFIFVFFSSPMTVKMPRQDSDTVRWYRFINSSRTVESTPFRTGYTGAESEISVAEGGYLIVIGNGAVADTFRIWVFYDLMSIDSISDAQNCSELRLTLHLKSYRQNFSAYDYYDFCDLNDVIPRFISNNFSVDWSADTDIYDGVEGISQSWQNTRNTLVTSIKTPFKDARYSAKITNVFGNTAEFKTGLIKAMGTYSAFDVLIPDKSGVFRPTQTYRGEALWRMRLENKSINADSFEWTGLNDQTVNFLKDDTLWTYNTENVPDEIVYKPGEFPVSLLARNTQTGCVHTVWVGGNEQRTSIVVEKSSFSPESMPNAFTPNGDGNNDVFTFVNGQEPKSMRNIDIVITNRNGMRVYRYKGAIADWEGWNGKMNGNGSECSSGVYYYVIRGDGWDDKNYSGKTYSGALHLFRGN